MKRIALIAAAVLASFQFATNAASKEPLRVGITPTSEPIQFIEQNKPVGLEIDFAEKLGKELGRDIEFVHLKFRELIPALLSNQIDIIMSGMSVTKIRELQVSFANPYLRIGQMALARFEDRSQYNFPFDVIMTDKKIGATENTTSEYLVVQEFPKAKKSLFPDHEPGVKALKKKKIDLLIMDSPYVWWYSMKNEGKLTPVPFPLTEEYLAWAVRKDNVQLLGQVNGILSKWKKSGELDAMIQKRIPGFK